MNEDKSFIKLHRKMLKWEWYNDTHTKTLFLHCLLKANWKDGRFEGHEIPRGSFVTSVKQLSSELSNKKQKFSIQSIRTSLKHLVSTNELTIKSTSKFTVITINNYDLYQDTNKVSNIQLTNNQQTTNNQLTTIEEYKNIRNKEYISNCCKRAEELFERKLGPAEVDLISEWVVEKEYSEELIKEAIRLTIVNGKKYLNYTIGILNNWEDKGYKTLEEVRKTNITEEKEPVEVYDYDWINGKE